MLYSPGILMLFTFLLIAAAMSAVLPGCGKEEEKPVPEDTVFVRHLTSQYLHSSILNRDIAYEVLLPDGYRSSGLSYPVIYLLHGLGEDQTGWYSASRLYYYTTVCRAEAGDAIFVMPQGFNSYYVNKFNGRFDYMDMFTRELVPAIDSIYRTRPEPGQRAVMGYSMGGYGALILPVKNPDVFGVSVPLSMSFRTDEQYLAEPGSVFDYQWGPVFGGSRDDRFSDCFIQNSPFHFFNTGNISAFDGLKIFMDCGDDEETLSFTANSLHSLMRKNGIPHEFRMRDGGHTWDYWQTALPEALRFIGTSFRGEDYPEIPEKPEVGQPVPSGNIKMLEIAALGNEAGIMTPPSYDTGSTLYPVIYYIHDISGGQREAETQDIFALLYNSMTMSKVPPAIAVEIPALSTDLVKGCLNEIIVQVEETYRAGNKRENRIILGNGLGGNAAGLVCSEDTTLAASCFIFEASLEEGVMPAGSKTFYYLDSADESASYGEYEQFYSELRRKGIPYEYRVRQGDDGFSTFLSAVAGAIPEIKKHLKT